MTRDFDDLLPSDRTFKIRGESFEFIDVSPEVIQAWTDSTNGQPDKTVWQQQDEQIMVFLKTEDRARWKELRKRKENPITIGQQNAVLTWLFEAATGIPTSPASPSPSGPGNSAG